MVSKTQYRGKEELSPQFVKSGGKAKIHDLLKIKVYKDLKNDRTLFQVLSQWFKKKEKTVSYVLMFRIRKSKLNRRYYMYFTNGKVTMVSGINCSV